VTAERPLGSVVDDDESVRESLPGLLGELGYETPVFPSAEEFLKSITSTKPNASFLTSRCRV
jgi:FixJ family two-component response regulator